MVAAVLLSGASRAGAVVADRLLHDTQRTREALKEETGAAVIPAREETPEAASPEHGDFESIWFAREKYLQIGENEKAQQRALEEPIRQIVVDAGVEGAVIVQEVKKNKKSSFGFNAATEEYGDMLEAGIIDRRCSGRSPTARSS